MISEWRRPMGKCKKDLYNLFTIVQRCPHSIPGPPVRQIPAQHRRFHPGQGARPQDLANHSQTRSPHLRSSSLRPEPEEGEGDGAADQDAAGSKGVRLQGRRTIPGVSPLLCDHHEWPLFTHVTIVNFESYLTGNLP